MTSNDKNSFQKNEFESRVIPSELIARINKLNLPALKIFRTKTVACFYLFLCDCLKNKLELQLTVSDIAANTSLDEDDVTKLLTVLEKNKFIAIDKSTTPHTFSILRYTHFK